MHEKTGFAILGLTLLVAVVGMVLLQGGIEGSAIIGAREYTAKPQCPQGYDNTQYTKTPMPINCVKGINPDGSYNKYYMCCNPYWITKEYAQPRYYTQSTQQARYGYEQ